MHELHNLMDTSDAVSGLHENWQAHSDYALFPCSIECRRGLAQLSQANKRPSRAGGQISWFFVIFWFWNSSWCRRTCRGAKGGLKNAKRPIPSKIALWLKKICYKVSFCENSQHQSCRAFIGLSIHAKVIGGLVGDVPFYMKIMHPPLSKMPILHLSSRVAPQP